MLKRHWHYLLLLFLLFDLGYSFWHYLQFPLDGDLATVVWPHESFLRVLHDPFGLGVLLDHDVYPAPNRFFAHYFMFGYFRHVPLLLQKLSLSPVDSVYMACGLLKIAVHALMVYVLAVAVSNRYHVLNSGFLLAAALVASFLQTSGFNNLMGVIDWSITYTWAYALPLGLLLLFFLPFVRSVLHDVPLQVSGVGVLGLVGLAVVLAFNGPVVPATALLICPTALLLCWHRRFAARPATEPVGQRAWRALGELPPVLLLAFGLLSLLSLYSLYIGRSNSENLWVAMPLAERYARLAQGVLFQLTGEVQLTDKYGYSLLLGMLLVNAVILSQCLPTPQAARVQAVLKWLGLFAVVYLLLLPLGGYRSYREYIVRRDSILPITLGMMGAYAFSAYYLLTHLSPATRWAYATLVVASLAVFTFTDQYQESQSNACERSLFAQLAASPEPIVRLPATCTLMDWQPLTDYRKSELNAGLLHYWGIVKTPKRYYQQQEPIP
ncbi:hypothetical protein [Hymenobacter sp. B1770]|uniref:hypothetical protein n=1 Tax=Hymenobacter sp. B1770 TaxID=1718788 RepID=UPI003CECF1CB